MWGLDGRSIGKVLELLSLLEEAFLNLIVSYRGGSIIELIILMLKLLLSEGISPSSLCIFVFLTAGNLDFAFGERPNDIVSLRLSNYYEVSL